MKPLISFPCLILCAGISIAGLSCKPKSDSSQSAQAPQSPFTRAESALKAAGSIEQVEGEATELLERFAGQGLKSLSTVELSASPILNKLASGVGGEIIGIWPDPKTAPGLPAHIRIRFGNPQHYSFIYIMAKGKAVSNTPELKKLGGNIFVKE